MKKNVLGVTIDDINMDQALDIVHGWLKVGGKHYIVTPNPEILVAAQRDKEFKDILNNADLSIPDGVGLKLSGDIVCILPGIDFMEELIKEASDQGFTVGLLGGRDQVAKKAAECLRKKYPKIKITFAASGGDVDKNGKLLKLPKLPKMDILFVGFGPPKQEKWIANNFKKIPVKVAMAVGGSLDYVSGRVPRVPKFLRAIGLEWLFRLIVQPWRIKRQLFLFKYLWLLARSGRRRS